MKKRRDSSGDLLSMTLPITASEVDISQAQVLITITTKGICQLTDILLLVIAKAAEKLDNFTAMRAFVSL